MPQRLGTLILLTVAAALVAAAAPSAAAGESPEAEASTGPTVYIVDGKRGLRFVAPRYVYSGEDLTVVERANPRRIGPDTFSLVTKGAIPRSPGQRRRCFTPRHICTAIAEWHGVEDAGPPNVNPAEAGEPGWDALGNQRHPGDSWFTGEERGASITQAVTAPGGTRLYFMSAVHPWLHGSIGVRRPPTEPAPAG